MDALCRLLYQKLRGDSVMGFPDILNYIMHPLSDKYIQEIIAGKLHMVILLRYSSIHCSCHSTTFCINIEILHIDHHLYSVSRDTLMHILYILYTCYDMPMSQWLLE